MFWILTIMALVVSTVVAIIVGGLATPRAHVASRTIVLNAAPDAVWQLIRNVRDYPDWRDEIQSVSVDSDAAADFRWTELGRQKSTSYRATVDEPPTRFTSQIVGEDLGYSVEWKYVITPSDNGTRVTITESGQVNNPALRFFGTHFIGFTKAIDAYLLDLAAHFGEHAKPQDVAP